MFWRLQSWAICHQLTAPFPKALGTTVCSCPLSYPDPKTLRLGFFTPAQACVLPPKFSQRTYRTSRFCGLCPLTLLVIVILPVVSSCLTHSATGLCPQMPVHICLLQASGPSWPFCLLPLGLLPQARQPLCLCGAGSDSSTALVRAAAHCGGNHHGDEQGSLGLQWRN